MANKNRRMVSAKSRAGIQQRRHEFTATEPSRLTPVEGERPDGKIWEVCVRIGPRKVTKILGTYQVRAQAEAHAAAQQGFVREGTTMPPIPAREVTLPSTRDGGYRPNRWVIVGERVIKGFPTAPSPAYPKGGFMMFATPIHVVEVRGAHWAPLVDNIKISRSATAVTVTFPNGEKVSHTPTSAKVWMLARFGSKLGTLLCQTLGV